MQTFTYVIQDELGIHARPAGLVVKEAKQYASTITLLCGGKSASAKGLIAVMGMALKRGNEVTITAEGEDEIEAIAAMEKIFHANL